MIYIVCGLTMREVKAGFEGYSMEEGERGLEGGSQGTTKTGNDWKINGL